jgi:hypothetical protein
MTPAGLVLVWLGLCLSAWGAPAVAPAERTQPGEFSLAQLLSSLAKDGPAEVRYEERTFSSLVTEPLKANGILRFTPPATLEKHVLAPKDERYLVEADRVVVEVRQKRIRKVLALEDYPVLRAFVEAFRATLAGDARTLERFYQVRLEGTAERWILTMRPREQEVLEVVRSVRISGGHERLRQVEILSPDGDRSVMNIAAGGP